MFSKLKTILTYYDSEPTEIMQGVVWLVFFPIVHTLDCGLNLWFIIPSMALGLASIQGACTQTVKVRKTLGLGVFIFSVVTVVYYFICGKMTSSPVHLGWFMVMISAFFNLKRLSNHYYTKHHGSSR